MTVLYGIVGCYSCVSLRAARAVLTLARMRRCGASMRLRAARLPPGQAERALLSGLVEGCPEAVLAVQTKLLPYRFKQLDRMLELEEKRLRHDEGATGPSANQ